VTEPCLFGNKPKEYIKDREFLDLLSGYCLLIEGYAHGNNTASEVFKNRAQLTLTVLMWRIG